jgi:hypothetical protein
MVTASLLNKSESEISRLSAQLRASQETIQGLEHRLNSFEQRVSSLEAQQQHFRTQLAANTNTIGPLTVPPSASMLAKGVIWLPAKRRIELGGSSIEFDDNDFDVFNFSFKHSVNLGVPFSTTRAYSQLWRTFPSYESYDPFSNQFSTYQQSSFPSLFGVRSTPKFNYTEFGLKLSF